MYRLSMVSFDPPTEDFYDIMSFQDLLDSGWKIENIDRQIDAIVAEYKVVDNSEEEWGTAEKWVRVLNETSDSAFALFSKDEPKK